MSASAPLLRDDTAVLGPFVDAGALDASAVHVADAIARAVGGIEPVVLLGAALAARAPRFGHICVVPADVAGSIVVDDAHIPAIDSLPWPDPARWRARLSASPAVCAPADPPGDVTLPLVWDGTRLYLERYWRFEQRVADDLLGRAGTVDGFTVASPAVDAILDELFGPDDPLSPDRQRDAVERALTRRLTVVAGGPGTGKTRTVARLLAAAYRIAFEGGQALEVALAAPTGKASARMTEAVHAEVEVAGLTDDIAGALRAAEATTLHRLLGASGGGRFRHDRSNPLPHDMVVVDETSMVALGLMARLLDAVRPDATLVLVGDPFQLASVEAGAVLGEIVGTATTPRPDGPLAADIVMLERVHRFGVDSAIAALADAIRAGDADRALDLLDNNQTGELTWVDGDDEAGIDRLQEEAAVGAVEVVRAAHAGDAESGLHAASDLKVLCATRLGALGVYRWSDRIEALAARAMPDGGIGRRWYVGRPVIVTSNDYLNRLFNGDVGLVVAGPDQPVVAFPDPSGTRELAMSQLGDIETWWAMTIHKSQGSEFRRVIVTLPPAPSPILTRELLYTAVTRAKEQVTLVATAASLRAAITRPVARASGLGPKLWPRSAVQ
ncbi:MAG: exodeoxyribonuclease V subunit alpha [Acidimicrobiia bacterium]|nr:exodeoxyribonuclease V subunit alpha [Acidimicrobiia bacterium]